MWKSHRRLVAITALIVASNITAGCNRSEPLGRVYGKVTFQGEPVTAGILVFSNHEKGVHMTAELGPDGSYELQTAGGFGLPLGTYKIAVNTPIPEPPVYGAMNSTPVNAPRANSAVNIPKKYQDYETSGLSITVEKGENRFDIEMNSER
jgi:hypothetical protein